MRTRTKIHAGVATLFLAACTVGIVLFANRPEGEPIPDDETCVLAFLEMYCYRHGGQFPATMEDALKLRYSSEAGLQQVRKGNCLYQLLGDDLLFTYYLDQATKQPVLIFHDEAPDNTEGDPSKREGTRIPLGNWN